MPRFEVRYIRLTEIIEADRYLESKGWIVFQRDDEDGVPVEIVRIKGSRIQRIERLED